MIRRSHVTLSREIALHADRALLAGGTKLVYVLVADKKLQYPRGRSRIAYIGTTKNGSSRVAESVAWRAEEILNIRGVYSFDARVVTCRPRRHVKTWLKLEKALIIAFRETLGDVPYCNVHGKNMVATDHFQYFARSRLVAIIDELS